MSKKIDYSEYVVAASSTGGKFWEIEIEGVEVRTRYGKVGQDKKWSSKSYGSEEEAMKEGLKALRKKTNKGYAPAPKPVTISHDYAGEDLSALDLGGVFYFRALDRYPGGNADMFTLKVTMRASAGEAPEFRHRLYRNWDGQHYEYAEAGVALDVSASWPPLRDVVQEIAAANLAQDETYLVHEGRYDHEEYDTEWSSIELGVYVLGEDFEDAHEIERGDLIARFMQKSTTGKASEASGLERAFFDGVVGMLGIGRVEKYGEGQDAFSSACENSSVASQRWSNQDIPIYL